MNINVNADKTLAAIKANPLSVLVVFVAMLALLFAYMWQNESNRVTGNCDNDLKKLRSEYVDFQISCNNEMIAIRKECRIKMDSIEDNYYGKFRKQERQISKLESDIDNIKNQLR